MQRIYKMALLASASVAFVGGVTGAVLFFPGDYSQGIQAHGASQIPWQTSFAAASEQAKREHKYILADVYTDWCGWCKRLDKDVFTKSKLIDYLQKDFVCVKVNAEEPKEGVKVAEAYKVNGYPCALVFSPEGKMVGRIAGYEDAGQYVHSLQDIVAGRGEP